LLMRTGSKMDAAVGCPTVAAAWDGSAAASCDRHYHASPLIRYRVRVICRGTSLHPYESTSNTQQRPARDIKPARVAS
jgi:hypothetical protein